MIRVKLSGGLGNQLFQYACARSIGLRLNTHVVLDLEKFRYDALRQFSLSKLQIKGNVYEDEAPKSRFHDLLRSVEQVLFPYYTITDPVWEYDQRIFTTKNKRLILDGYWGMVGYFQENRTDLLKELQLKKNYSKKIEHLVAKLQQEESVGIHFRFGDYASVPSVAAFFGTLSPVYYNNALQYISQHVQKPVYYVFSNDIPRAIEVLHNLDHKFKFIIVNEHGYYDDVEELFIMASCKHNIIANSTFSWWASWLNQNPQKIIIHPRQWFKDEKAQWVAENIQPLYQRNSILL